jgi:hypothetical protein
LYFRPSTAAGSIKDGLTPRIRRVTESVPSEIEANPLAVATASEFNARESLLMAGRRIFCPVSPVELPAIADAPTLDSLSPSLGSPQADKISIADNKIIGQLRTISTIFCFQSSFSTFFSFLRA